MSIPLGAVSLAGASVSGITTVLTKKYQKKLTKVRKLADIIMPAIAVFETCLSKALKNGKINEEEFNLLQTFQLTTMNELMGIDHKMEAVNRNQFEKPTGRDKRSKEKPRNKSLIVCSLCYFMCYLKNG